MFDVANISGSFGKQMLVHLSSVIVVIAMVSVQPGGQAIFTGLGLSVLSAVLLKLCSSSIEDVYDGTVDAVVVSLVAMLALIFIAVFMPKASEANGAVLTMEMFALWAAYCFLGLLNAGICAAVVRLVHTKA